MEKQPSYIETFGALNPPKVNLGVDGFMLSVARRLGGTICWKARFGSPQESPLIDMVAKLSLQMGIQNPPELFIYSSPIINAASVINGKVLVSSALLSMMTPEQVEGVVAHELAHHRHKMRDNTIMWGGAVGSHFVYRNAFRPRLHSAFEGIKNKYGRIAAYIAAPVIAFLGTVGLINLYQQSIEYESDRESGQVTGHPKVMAEALNVVGEHYTKIYEKERHETRSKMSETRKRVADTIERVEPKWLRRIRHSGPFEVLGSHPPISLRVKALEAQEASLHSNEQSLPTAPVIR